QMKVWEYCALWLSHQSLFALKSATNVGSHNAHTSSGTPCSAHHQPSWLCPAAAAFSPAAPDAAPFFVDLLHAVIDTATSNAALNPSIFRKVISILLSKTNTNLPQRAAEALRCRRSQSPPVV